MHSPDEFDDVEDGQQGVGPDMQIDVLVVGLGFGLGGVGEILEQTEDNEADGEDDEDWDVDEVGWAIT